MGKWLFGVDESGTKQTPVSGFGALIVPWERRGDIRQQFKEIVARHPGHMGEVKWQKVSADASYALARELVEFFFKRPWLGFHCMVVRKGLIKKDLHKDYDEAWRKNLCSFLVNKARLPATRIPGEDHVVHVWADTLPSRYAKAAETLDIIANKKLARFSGSRVELKVFEHDSKKQPLIQLCDLLLGAVIQSWSKALATGNKAELQSCIAGQLCWQDLRHGTFGSQRKFNIWHLHDHGADGRKVRGKQVNLKGSTR